MAIVYPFWDAPPQAHLEAYWRNFAYSAHTIICCEQVSVLIFPDKFGSTAFVPKGQKAWLAYIEPGATIQTPKPWPAPWWLPYNRDGLPASQSLSVHVYAAEHSSGLRPFDPSALIRVFLSPGSGLLTCVSDSLSTDLSLPFLSLDLSWQSCGSELVFLFSCFSINVK